MELASLGVRGQAAGRGPAPAAPEFPGPPAAAAGRFPGPPASAAAEKPPSDAAPPAARHRKSKGTLRHLYRCCCTNKSLI